MVSDKPIKIIILGAGAGGTALIDLFTRSSGVEITGVADKDLAAPGLKRARAFNTPVTDDAVDLMSRNGTGLIMDVTGDPQMGSLIAKRKGPGVEVLGGTAAKLLWNLVQHEDQMRAQLLQADKLATIGTFSAGIAHDINNPLYLIMSLSENLSEEKDPAEIRQNADEILRAVRKIREIITGLTEYTRLSSAEAVQDADLGRTIDEALKLVRYATVWQDVTVIKEYSGYPLVSIRPQELLQLLINLITNAIQAMDGKGTLRLSVCSEGDATLAKISDTGPGIAQDLTDKIFEPFFTTKPAGKGTGLGLYMAQTIAKKYGGRIWVESQESHGTTFCLMFPGAR
jgi:two-component system, NtrC family, sensor kinase